MIIAEIIPITSSILAESLSYFSATNITPGTIVTIPLRKQKIRGIVISTSEVQNLKQNLRQQNFKIRNIIKIHDETIFSLAYLTTIQQLKNYYILPAGKLIDISYPKYITKNIEEFSYKKNKREISLQKKYTVQLLQKTYKQRISYYKKFIAKKIKEKQSVHIICPTVLEVKKISADLKPFFHENMYSFHGKTTKKNISQAYRKMSSEVSLILSTPSFLDLPTKNKTILILENDSSSYYYRAVSPKIDFRIFIEEYAKNAKLSFLIADNILRPVRFKEIKKQNMVDNNIFSSSKISLVSALNTKKIKQSAAERIKDLAQKNKFSPFSAELLLKITNSINKNEKIFFYTRRKNLAPSIMCRDCGQLAQDRETKVPYSLYVKKQELFYINRISAEILPAFDLCQFCNSWRLQTLGIGTETIAQELKKKFPHLTVSIIDSNHTPNQTLIHKTLKNFNEESEKTKILIGTQMALPYLKNIDSSFIVSIDGIFYQNSYSNEEQLLYIVKQIYDTTKHHVYIQTRNIVKLKKKKLDVGEKETGTKDPLQISFSRKLSTLIQNKKYSPETARYMTSRYASSLEIWKLIQKFDFEKFIKKKNNEQNKLKTILKITHYTKKENYIKLLHIYEKRFEQFSPHIQSKLSKNKAFIDLFINLHIDTEKWNRKYQDPELYKLIPFGERNISLEINPEIF